MRLKEFDIDIADATLTGFASNVTGAAFTLTANAATDGLAHQVSIKNDSANDHSGKTVTLVGTDADGKPLTEVVTGPAGSATVESAGYFLTLTSATPSASIGADTFDIGWVDEVASKTIPINRHSDLPATLAIDVTGTIDFTVQQTFEDVQVVGSSAQQSATWHEIITGSADLVAQSGIGANALRILVNSHSSGAELQAHFAQP